MKSIQEAHPAFRKRVYAGAPIVETPLRAGYFRHMRSVFNRNYFTNDGPLVRELEKKVAHLHGVRHCVALCNATVAQILVLKALELEGEVILPSFTFIATAHACLWQNLTPVFCDIRPDGMADPASAERLITDRTSAIIGVDLFGNLCERHALRGICRTHRLKWIIDAAHSFDCGEGKRRVGQSGDAEILSFHATKFFSTFEGGAVLTNDPKLAERLRFLRNFGFRDYDDVGFLGINGKMAESNAAMGLASMPFLEKRRTRLKKNRELFDRLLSRIPGIRLLEAGEHDRTNYRYVVATVERSEFGISRDLLIEKLAKDNCVARRYFYPGCHRMEPYHSLKAKTDGALPVTEMLCKKILCLPSWFESPEKDIPRIVRLIERAALPGKRVS